MTVIAYPEGFSQHIFWMRIMRFILIIFVSIFTTALSSTPDSRLKLAWFAPFLSGGGYSSEAISFVSELDPLVDLVTVQHGDSFDAQFAKSLPKNVTLLLAKSMNQWNRDFSEHIAICHSEPGAWSTPEPKYATSRCPPRPCAYKIGRTMFETDRIPDGWADRCNMMNEIWVPTEFHRKIFAKYGVKPHKLVVIPETVDLTLYDPSKTQTLEWLTGRRKKPNGFCFLSIFKWEERKGWKILLDAYFQEFQESDNVELVILTHAYHSDDDFEAKIAQHIKTMGHKSRPSVTVLTDNIPGEDMPKLYKSCDAFVLPSRGEGWGRPHIEAMAMELPVIATNWSGNTQFMNNDNSFLISVSQLIPVKTGPFKDHMWADPSVKHLRTIMRQVVRHPQHAKELGLKARKDIEQHYSPQTVADIILENLNRIHSTIFNKQKDEL